MMPNKLGQDPCAARSGLNETLQPYSLSPKRHPSPRETFPREPALLSPKTRAGTMKTDVATWHTKATGILTQLSCQVNDSRPWMSSFPKGREPSRLRVWLWQQPNHLGAGWKFWISGPILESAFWQDPQVMQPQIKAWEVLCYCMQDKNVLYWSTHPLDKPSIHSFDEKHSFGTQEIFIMCLWGDSVPGTV